MTALLHVTGLSKRFRGLTAVAHVTFSVRAGHIHGLIGPNGAGKTTVFNLISGVLPPDDGEIAVDGRSVTRLPVHARAGLGLARTFQNIRLFDGMTVLENVATGAHARLTATLMQCLFRTPAWRAEERRLREQSLELLEVVGLRSEKHPRQFRHIRIER